MKLAEIYSNSCSIDKIGKPNLPIQYYPVPADKYITIQNSSGMPAKDYDLWQDAVNLIYPFLQKENIEIVQIGQGSIRPLNHTINLLNQTNFAQSVYILRNALLHAGNDSWAAHAAVDAPVTILYGSTSVSAHSPYYFESRSKFIESHRNGKNPSFQAQEGPKTINFIKPELVAREILSILDIPNNINQETIFVGDNYFNSALEIIPDQIVDPNTIPPGHVNLRGDLFFDLNNIIENLKVRQYILHLDQEIDVNILKALKPNIPLLIFEIDENTRVDYLKSIIRLGIGLQLTTRLGKETHNSLKLDYLDLPMVFRKETVTFEDVIPKLKVYNNLDDEGLNAFIEKIKNTEIKYKSNKHILSQGKLYYSLMDWKSNKSAENIEGFSIGDLNNEDFLSEISHFLLYV